MSAVTMSGPGTAPLPPNSGLAPGPDALKSAVAALRAWQWREGDVALWDNRATQHYAVADFGTQPREVRRVTVAGDVPRSIGGRSSVVLQGDATDFSTVASLVS